jgi:hypothetical protein
LPAGGVGGIDDDLAVELMRQRGHGLLHGTAREGEHHGVGVAPMLPAPSTATMAMAQPS